MSICEVDLRAFPPGLLGVPTQDWMWTESALALMQLRDYMPPGSGTTFLTQSLSSIAAKREDLAKTLLKVPRLQWLCYVDSDMVPPPHAIAALLSHNLDIVAGSFVSRHPPYVHSARWLDREPTEEEMQRPVRVRRVGFGMILIRRRVFEALAQPWFAEDPTRPGVGEDFHFCDRAHEAGFHIHVDMNLEIGHLGVAPITPIFRDLFAQTAKGRECMADLQEVRRAEVEKRAAVQKAGQG